MIWLNGWRFIYSRWVKCNLIKMRAQAKHVNKHLHKSKHFNVAIAIECVLLNDVHCVIVWLAGTDTPFKHRLCVYVYTCFTWAHLISESRLKCLSVVFNADTQTHTQGAPSCKARASEIENEVNFHSSDKDVLKWDERRKWTKHLM